MGAQLGELNIGTTIHPSARKPDPHRDEEYGNSSCHTGSCPLHGGVSARPPDSDWRLGLP